MEQITCLGHWDLSLVTRDYFANRTRLSYIQFGFGSVSILPFAKEKLAIQDQVGQFTHHIPYNTPVDVD